MATLVSCNAPSERTDLDTSASALVPSPRVTTLKFFPPYQQPDYTAQLTTSIGVLNLDVAAASGGAVFRLDASLTPRAGGTPVTVSGYVPPVVTVIPGALDVTFSVATMQRQPARLKVTATALTGASGTASATVDIGADTSERGNALFDLARRVRACGAIGAHCETTGIAGRGHPDGQGTGTPEAAAEAPNTLEGRCDDGDAPAPDRSIDGLKIATDSGGALGAGRAVTIGATVWGGGRLDLYSAPDATRPSWTLITSFSTYGPGKHDVSAPFVLPPGSLQAIRATFVDPKVPVSSCPPSRTGDVDDLVFAADNGGPPTNIPPAVSAQLVLSNIDRPVIILPQQASLLGTASDDGLPAALVPTWAMISGPGPVVFDQPDQLGTSASFSVPGDYLLRFAASDGAATSSADIAVRVAAENLPPVVDAGPDQVIPMLAPVLLAGSVIDDDLPQPYYSLKWTLVSGPAPVEFERDGLSGTDFVPDPTALFSTPGVYVLRLTADDDDQSSFDDVTITVMGASTNQPPLILGNSAWSFSYLNWPNNAGVYAYDDGLPNPLSYSWSQVSGPTAATLQNGDQAVITFTLSAPGTYRFRVTVSDGEFSTSQDIDIIGDQPATLNAGPDQIIPWGSAAILAGSSGDDGNYDSYLPLMSYWLQVDGPGTVMFTDPLGATTAAVFPAPGRYTLNYWAHDGYVSSNPDSVTITVVGANRAPVVEAGRSQAVTLPTAATLSATITDDGLPTTPGTVSTVWSKVSGPGAVSFAAPLLRTTTAAFSTPGRYVLRVTANDGDSTSFDDVTITVRR